jgi:hypothetical protein
VEFSELRLYTNDITSDWKTATNSSSGSDVTVSAPSWSGDNAYPTCDGPTITVTAVDPTADYVVSTGTEDVWTATKTTRSKEVTTLVDGPIDHTHAGDYTQTVDSWTEITLTGPMSVMIDVAKTGGDATMASVWWGDGTDAPFGKHKLGNVNQAITNHYHFTVAEAGTYTVGMTMGTPTTETIGSDDDTATCYQTFSFITDDGFATTTGCSNAEYTCSDGAPNADGTTSAGMPVITTTLVTTHTSEVDISLGHEFSNTLTCSVAITTKIGS